MVIAAMVLTANLVLLNETRKLVLSYSSQQNQATWFLLQLSKEISELVSEASHLGDGDVHLPRVMLKYELAWSRFDLIMTSKESDEFMSLPGTKAFFSSQFTQFKAIEPLLKKVDESRPETGEVFHREVRQLYDNLIAYINKNFSVASPLYTEKREQVNRLEALQVGLLILLVGSILLIGLIFSKELKHSRRLALTDTLTSLGNRLALFSQVEELNNANRPFVIYLLDLNGFKSVNDKYGHVVGDTVLQEVAKRLNQMCDKDQAAYRIGGDEFAVLVPCDQLDNKQSFADQLSLLFGSLFHADHITLDLSTSVGFATFPDDSVDIDDLVRCADNRMYHMKFAKKKEAGNHLRSGELRKSSA